MNRRTALTIACSAPLLAACLYDQYFDIEWDEEVQLHDGRVIVVHVKRTFERVVGGIAKFERWRGVHRDTEISFDAGGSIGRFTKKFQRYDIGFLHQKNGEWYLAMAVTTGSPPLILTSWEKSVLKLERDGSLLPFARKDLPFEFKTINIMPVSPDSAGVSKFHNRLLRLNEKNLHWAQHPRSAGDSPTTAINRK